MKRITYTYSCDRCDASINVGANRSVLPDNWTKLTVAISNAEVYLCENCSDEYAAFMQNRKSDFEQAVEGAKPTRVTFVVELDLLQEKDVEMAIKNKASKMIRKLRMLPEFADRGTPNVVTYRSNFGFEIDLDYARRAG